MGIWQAQTNFNRGELDPTLTGRVDLQAYYNGVFEATNVVTVPQGGMKKRSGMRFLGEALGDGRLEQFSFNVEQDYLMVFTADKLQIYKGDNDALHQTIATTPWDTAAVLQDFDYIQSADTAIIVHPDVAPQLITRNASEVFAITAAPLTNIPKFDFNDTGSPTAVSEIQELTFVNTSAGDRYKLSLDGILTEEIVFSDDDDTNDTNVRLALLDLINTANSGVTVSFSTLVATITFSDESAKPFDLLVATPVVTELLTFAATSTRSQTGVPSSEDTWSDGLTPPLIDRGWPRTATFHEGRLYFGGSRSRPATLWGSRVGDFFNFDQGRSRDDESIEATLDTDQVNAIEGIFSNRSLQIFTSGGEFFVRQRAEEPITPTNIAVTPQSNLGAKRIRPVTIDGVTLFVQRTGKAINQFVFVNELQSNTARSISVLASHLINNPIKMVASRGTETTDSNYVYILNDTGNLTVFNTLLAEDVTAFTNWITDGNIKSIAVVGTTLYHLTERTIGGVAKFYLEREGRATSDPEEVYQTDSAKTSDGFTGNTIGDLTHLEGETVKVIIDGSVQPDAVVVGGEITVAPESGDDTEVGLEFQPKIVTMPLNQPLQGGPSFTSKKHIYRVAVNLNESNGVIVNGNRIADKTIGQNQFDPPTPNTGIKRIRTRGWSLEAQVTITQTTPYPFHILSLNLEVKT